MLAPLPIPPHVALGLINEALALLPAAMTSNEARQMILAICMQESGLATRWQILDKRYVHHKGPARGLAQFERMGGCAEVATHPAVKRHTINLCAARNCPPTIDGIYAGIERDDILALGLARLLLWVSPTALPELGDEEGAWRLYTKQWKPGKPHRDRWADNYPSALRILLQDAF